MLAGYLYILIVLNCTIFNNRILNTRFIKVDPNDCKMPLKFKTVTVKLYVTIYRINKIVLV